MYCPKCNIRSLATMKVKGSDVKIEKCSECKGLWFDACELNALVDVALKEIDIPRSSSISGHVCPVCKKSLISFRYPQTLVTVEQCEGCGGMWLDHNEIHEIKAVRRDLERDGLLEEDTYVGGIKGKLLKFVNQHFE